MCECKRWLKYYKKWLKKTPNQPKPKKTPNPDNILGKKKKKQNK